MNRLSNVNFHHYMARSVLLLWLPRLPGLRDKRRGVGRSVVRWSETAYCHSTGVAEGR